MILHLPKMRRSLEFQIGDEFEIHKYLPYDSLAPGDILILKEATCVDNFGRTDYKVIFMRKQLNPKIRSTVMSGSLLTDLEDGFISLLKSWAPKEALPKLRLKDFISTEA